jgi:hypothetical protein
LRNILIHSLLFDWVRKVNKNLPNASSQWKMLVHMFPLIGKRIAWKVGSGLQVWAGSDAIVGCNNDVLLPREITNYLRNIG